MLALPVCFLLAALSRAQSESINSQNQTYTLCVHTETEYNKCIHTLHLAENRSLPFALTCVLKDTEEDCMQSVSVGETDMVVLGEHDYKEARHLSLKPVIFEREPNTSVYIAVAPRDITVVQLIEADINVNASDIRAFDAAVLFNSRRGREICRFINPADASPRPRVRIVAYEEYVPDPDEILICADLTYGEADNYEECNMDSWLQRAVFVREQTSTDVVPDLKVSFDTILEHFGPHEDTADHFNFFSTFEGSDNVIFNNNAVDFDLYPTIRNGVTEDVFDGLHCHTHDQHHDDSQLE